MKELQQICLYRRAAKKRDAFSSAFLLADI